MKKLFLLITLILAAATLSADTIYLEGFGDSEAIRTITEGQIVYMSAGDFSRAAGGTLHWQPNDNRLTLYLEGHQFQFQLANIFCRYDSYIHNLIYAPVYYRDDLYLPVDRTLQMLNNVLSRKLVYDRGSGNVVVAEGDVNILAVNAVSKLNGILLEIVLSRKMEYDLFVTEGSWVNVTIYGGELDTDKITRMSKSRLIRRIRAFQFENSAQVSVRIRGKINSYHHNYASQPNRIQISIEDIEFSADHYDSLVDLNVSEFDPIDVIVIDPGHGGKHDGAIGRNGLKEKEVVLDIALKLEELLDRDVRFIPVLTRRDDRTVELEERAQIANNSNGDIFISIHANASDNRKAGGSETYFLATARTDEGRATEMLENSDFRTELPGVGSSGGDDLDFIVMDLLQTEYLNQSRQLSQAIQDEFKSQLNIRSRGINQAGFVVLNKVYMPSALVEAAFITNKIEEKLLARDQFRQKVAESIYTAIVKFAEIYERKVSSDVQ